MFPSRVACINTLYSSTMELMSTPSKYNANNNRGELQRQNNNNKKNT